MSAMMSFGSDLKNIFSCEKKKKNWWLYSAFSPFILYLWIRIQTPAFFLWITAFPPKIAEISLFLQTEKYSPLAKSIYYFTTGIFDPKNSDLGIIIINRVCICLFFKKITVVCPNFEHHTSSFTRMWIRIDCNQIDLKTSFKRKKTLNL